MFGKKLKALREHKDLTQMQLSKVTGISRTYISDVENERYTPSFSFIKTIATTLSKNGDEEFTTAQTLLYAAYQDTDFTDLTNKNI